MPKIKSAMPSYRGDKRILFPSVENFGLGSYDPFRGLHRGQLSGKKILPTKVNDTEINDITTFDQFPLIIFEN